MPAIARIGDPISHGGAVVGGSDNVFANDRGVARQGDFVLCARHGLKPIVGNCVDTVLVNGRPVAVTGSVAACGAVVISTSNVIAGG